MYRFDGVRKIYGEGADGLTRAHVLIVGLGGVGSWTAEALARSGIGKLTLIDPDDICVSNVNRQIMATNETIGKFKVDVLADRIRSIHPDCQVDTLRAFFDLTNADDIFAQPYDYVVDAIDGVMVKAHLISLAHQKNIPIITCGGAGGKRDPSLIRVTDLAQTEHDALLSFVRKKLRRVFGFPAYPARFNIPCIYSPEPVHAPEGVRSCDGADEELLADAGTQRACDGRLGATVFVTGTFGFLAAARVVNDIAGSDGQATRSSQNSA